MSTSRQRVGSCWEHVGVWVGAGGISPVSCSVPFSLRGANALFIRHLSMGSAVVPTAAGKLTPS